MNILNNGIFSETSVPYKCIYFLLSEIIHKIITSRSVEEIPKLSYIAVGNINDSIALDNWPFLVKLNTQLLCDPTV